MDRSPQRGAVDDEVAALGRELLAELDALADTVADRIRAAIPLYASGAVVDEAELRRTCRENVEVILAELGNTPSGASPSSRRNGRARARAGVPLAAVLEAYRLAARVLWEVLAHRVTERGVGAGVALRAASEMWQVLDTYSQEMADGYREEQTARAWEREQGRSALVQGLLEGRLSEAEVWEAADTLRLPRAGAFVAVAAGVAVLGERGLPGVEGRLAAVGMVSAWRLLHGEEVGVVWVREGGPGPDGGAAGTDADAGRGAGLRALRRLEEVLAAVAVRGAGVSGEFRELRELPTAVRYARLALASAGGGVSVFGRAPLAVAAVADPVVMRAAAAGVLAGLAEVPAEEREVLLGTLSVWLSSAGSVRVAAERLHCHPNTVRHRLRRLEERCGRSLSDPRAVADFALAMEVDRHSPAPPPPAPEPGQGSGTP